MEEPGVMADLEDLKPEFRGNGNSGLYPGCGNGILMGIYVLFPGRQRRAPCFTGEV